MAGRVQAGSVVGRTFLRFLKGFIASALAVFIAALTFLKGSYVPEGTWETLVWKTVCVAVISGLLLALEKLRKMLSNGK